MTLSTETLWAYVRGELPANEAAEVKAQLERSPEAQARLADVEASVNLLALMPEAPPMPAALARRVGAALADEVDEAASKSFVGWWQALLSPRVFAFAAVAAAIVLGFVWWKSPDAAVVTPPIAVVPERVPLQPVPVPSKPIKAVVASARKASSKSGSLSAAHVLETGASVSTETGGSLWLKLPDGTKAGLTSATDVKLAALSEHAVTLDVAKGSLALVVPHREDRLLTVRAGDVEVKDLGTRFLVSRELAKVVVAVEEGSVEVRTPSSTRVVTAGHAVAWNEGTLADYDWQSTTPAPPPPPSAPPVRPEVVAAPVVEQPQTPPVVAEDLEPETQDPDTEWAAPPSDSFATPTPPPPPPVDAPPDSVVTVQPGAPAPALVPRRRSGFDLRAIEENLKELKRQATLPLGTQREAQARAVRNFADQGACEEALDAADRWLAIPPRITAEEAAMRRDVLQQKVRCLNHLGRPSEALEVQRLLQP